MPFYSHHLCYRMSQHIPNYYYEYSTKSYHSSVPPPMRGTWDTEGTPSRRRPRPESHVADSPWRALKRLRVDVQDAGQDSMSEASPPRPRLLEPPSDPVGRNSQAHLSVYENVNPILGRLHEERRLRTSAATSSRPPLPRMAKEGHSSHMPPYPQTPPPKPQRKTVHLYSNSKLG
jgi:hypothetical protein